VAGLRNVLVGLAIFAPDISPNPRDVFVAARTESGQDMRWYIPTQAASSPPSRRSRPYDPHEFLARHEIRFGPDGLSWQSATKFHAQNLTGRRCFHRIYAPIRWSFPVLPS
jgi:hypothetical protein